MNKEQKIEEKFGRDTGFSVPEGFLEDIYTRVEHLRGPLPEITERQKPSRWQIFRPYIYLAAMFAGIWCMMKVFSVASETAVDRQVAMTEQTSVSLDNPPTLLAEAVESPEILEELEYNESISADASTDYELEQDIQDSFSDFEQFEEAFDYEFEDEYASINIEEVLADATSV